MPNFILAIGALVNLGHNTNFTQKQYRVPGFPR